MEDLYKTVNGKRVKLTDEEAAAIRAEWAASLAEQEEYERLNGYKDKRRKEYPDVKEQLDILYHQGYDGWKAEIKKIKDKYPKPE